MSCGRGYTPARKHGAAAAAAAAAGEWLFETANNVTAYWTYFVLSQFRSFTEQVVSIDHQLPVTNLR